MEKHMRRSFQFVIVTLLCAAGAFAQQDTRGTIFGRVTDASGGVVMGAAVRAVNPQTGVALEAKSNDAGNYSIPFLLPGTYDVSVQMPGFKSLERKGIEVHVADRVQVNLEMAVGDVSEKVEVVASAPLLETSTVSLGQVVDTKRITELPIQSGNAAEFVLLSPGTVNATDLRMRKAAFNNAPSQVATDGNAQYSNEFAIDGVPNTFAAGSNARIAFSPPQAAVAEFRVQTTTYDAALGHTPGAVINTMTTSGTNAFHGEAHWFVANSAFDAAAFFANRTGTKKTVYQDNRYGVSIGGPVVLPGYNGKNKTFFFYAWEGNKWGSPTTVIATVPTPAQKTGDFSALLKLGTAYQLYDPFSTTPTGTGHYSRTPIPNNVIPASSLNPVALAMAKYWPDPNQAGTSDGRNNYSQSFQTGEDYYVHFARIDHNFSERNRVFLRLDYDFWEEKKNVANTLYNPPINGVVLNRINRGVALDEVYTVSPSTVLNLRYGITQQDFPEKRMSQGFDLASLGFAQNLVSMIPKSLADFPYVNLPNYVRLSPWESGDGTNTGMVHAWNGSLTTLHGDHNFQYGGEFRLYRNFQDRHPYDVTPAFDFSNVYVNGPLETNAVASMGGDLAQFLMGVPAGQMQRTASFADQDTFFGFFFQDAWKVTRKLSVTLGLRIEHESPLSERFDRAVKGFAYNAANPIAAQAQAAYAKNPIPELPVSDFKVLGGPMFAGGSNGHNLWNGPSMEWLPRIGIAYQLTPKTVIRTGYGIFYDSLGTNWSSAIQTGFTATTPIIASYDNGVTYSASTANPFPTGLQAPVGSSLGLATNLGQTVSVYPLDRKLPYVQRWSFGFQRELPAGFLLDASYVGNRGTRLSVNHELDYTYRQYLSTSLVRDNTAISYLGQSFPNPFYGLASVYGTTISRANLLRPYPQFSSVMETDPVGFSFYNSLQATVQKRWSQGYTLNLAYTWSKSMDATAFLNNSDIRPYYGISSLDFPHRIVVSGVWELPFGKGKRYGASMPKWADMVAGGWQLNGMVTHQSGAPLAFGNIIFQGDIHNINLPGDQRSVDKWFNVDAGFNKNSSQQLASNIRAFPLRLAGVRGDGQNMTNLSAIKSFPITERIKFQFRAEAYNAPNHPNFNAPNMTVTSGSFGTITSQNGGPRSFQLAAKILF
jgi:hypothetical protein